MDSQQLTFEQTGLFEPVFIDYLSGHPQLQPFFNRKPELASFAGQIRDKVFPDSHRKTLHKSIKKQYTGIADAPKEAIDSLLSPNTYTVTTGHQLNIFGGPMYFIYKLATTIVLAQQLKQAYPDKNFIPIYWMATEDHDFEEIASLSLFGNTYAWQSEEQGRAVGTLSTAGLPELMAEMGKELPQYFREAYNGQRNLADATRLFVHALYGKNGLVILDAQDPALKQLFVPIMERELFDSASLHSVQQTTKALTALGYPEQVFPRSVNLFYLRETYRERIVRNHDGQFEVLNQNLKLSGEAMRSELAQNPERFSPNVVLRPLYQETILPNLAYVGGPSELAYWLQLKDLFQTFEVSFPIILPRNFALVLNNGNQKKMAKLELQAHQLFEDFQQLKETLIRKNTDVNISLDHELEVLEKSFEGIVEKALQIDGSLEGFVGAQKNQVHKIMMGIRKKLEKAEERKQETEIGQLASLKEKLFPQGAPQERVDNFLNFALNTPGFHQELLNLFEPFNFNYYILHQ